MPRQPRQVERLQFSSGELAPLVTHMDRLAAAGDGWVNLVPVDADREEQPTRLGFMTLFNGGGARATMITWIPSHSDRRGAVPQSIGISHLARRRVVGELAAADVAVPATWTVEQDHPHKGLIVRPPAGEASEPVVTWALRAVEVIEPSRHLASWRAEVHLPAG